MMEVAVMGGPLKKYNVTTSSGARTVIKLNDAEAARHGLTEGDLVGGAAPKAQPDEETPPKVVEEKAAPAAPNKARATSANKARTPRGASTKGGAGGGD
jgi:hypothetical protein